MFGSLSHVQPGDFQIGEVQEPDDRPHRHPALTTWPHAEFARCELIASNGGERDRYRDIGLRVSNLEIRGRNWDVVQFKLGIFDHLPEISFRDQRASVFDEWPPERADNRGPLIEYCPRSQGTKGASVAEVMMAMSLDDRQRLGSLLRALPAMVKAAGTLKGPEMALWVSAAETLRGHWLGEGWD